MRRICFVGLLLHWLLPLPVQAADKYALLIGVSKYEHSEMNRPEPLQYPEEDAKALGAVLKKGGYEVDILLGKEATLSHVQEKFVGLSDKGSADGIVLIGLFGHGVEIETRDSDNRVVMLGCFCPFNTKMRVATDSQGKKLIGDSGRPIIEPDPATSVKLSDLMIQLNLAKAGNRVVLADCCRTVPNQARGRTFGAGFRKQDLPENTSVFFGCSPNEKAFEHPDWKHGAFTKCLLEAIDELSSRGTVDTGNLSSLLKVRVPELVKSVAPRDRQTPKFFNTDLVDLQLASLSGSKPKPAPPSGTKESMANEPTKSGTTTSRGFEGTKAGDRKELNGIAFRWCRPGTFKMGEGDSAVDVELTRGFWLGETEVTQGQWLKVMGTTPWKGQKFVKEGDNYAASYIGHNDAVACMGKLTNQGPLPKGWKYSLPTEAQWEYACRTGTTTKYSFGDNESSLGDYGWFIENADNKKEEYAHVVGLKKANAWGLKDMHGNVFEWCSDWYEAKLRGGRVPIGAPSGSFRVLRGGCWSFDAGGCRSAYRSYDSPGNRSSGLGFRLAAVPE